MINHETITKCLTAESQLNMPQYPPHEIEEIEMFLIVRKVSKSRWKEIERAEKNDKEGNRFYKILKQEYLKNICQNQMQTHMVEQRTLKNWMIQSAALH